MRKRSRYGRQKERKNRRKGVKEGRLMDVNADKKNRNDGYKRTMHGKTSEMTYIRGRQMHN